MMFPWHLLLFEEGAADAAGAGDGKAAGAGGSGKAAGEPTKSPIDFDSVIFTTEAHPIRRAWD